MGERLLLEGPDSGSKEEGPGIAAADPADDELGKASTSSRLTKPFRPSAVQLQGVATTSSPVTDDRSNLAVTMMSGPSSGESSQNVSRSRKSR